MAFSNGISIVSGMFQRIVPCPVIFTAIVQWIVSGIFQWMLILVISGAHPLLAGASSGKRVANALPDDRRGLSSAPPLSSSISSSSSSSSSSSRFVRGRTHARAPAPANVARACARGRLPAGVESDRGHGGKRTYDNVICYTII